MVNRVLYPDLQGLGGPSTSAAIRIQGALPGVSGGRVGSFCGEMGQNMLKPKVFSVFFMMFLGLDNVFLVVSIFLVGVFMARKEKPRLREGRFMIPLTVLMV